MPVESAADRAALVSPDDFGETATYTPIGGGPADLDGVFNNPFLSVVIGEDAPSSDSQPTFTCNTDDLPGAAAAGVGDTLALDAENGHPAGSFAVVEINHDGLGMTVLVLGAV